MEIAIVLGLLIGAIVMFALEKLPVDLTTLLALMVLVLTGIISVEQAFAGFGNEIIIVLAALFVISGTLERSGVMDAVGGRLHHLARGGQQRFTLSVMGLAAGLSAFASNTLTTAVLIAPVLGVARKINVSPSKVMMPLAYASILGGTCTLIGTSTNVAVSGYVAQAGLRPIGLFEVTPIGLVLVLVGVVYVMVFGHHILPDHEPDSLAENYAIREYLSEIVVPPDSPLVGQRIFASELAALGVRILKVMRGGEPFIPGPPTIIQKGDIYFVLGKPEDLLKVKATAGIDIRPEQKLADLSGPASAIRVVEMLVTPQSDLRGRNLQEANFRERYGLTVLAIYRHRQSMVEKLSAIRMRTGDLLLVQGPADRLNYLRRHPDLWTLEEVDGPRYGTRKGLVTAGALGVGLVLSLLGIIPLVIAVLGAALVAVMVRAITMDEAYEFIDWRLLILIGGMTAFGTAMDESGTAAFLADKIVGWLSSGGDIVVLGGFLVLTVLLTQPMSNAAAALVVLPIALEAARLMGADERSFALAIMLAASVSFIAPFEPACILVYGPGKYRFFDFVKLGAGLTMVLLVIVLIMVPWLWPLR